MLGGMKALRTAVTAVALLTTALVACGDGTADDGDAGVDAVPGNVLDRLRAVDGVISVSEIATDYSGYRRFTILFEQPVNHDQPDGQKFDQLISLHHRDFDVPMILATTGYSNYFGDYLTEPASLLHGDQLMVEQRFFGDSRPDPADWDQLRIRQAAADHHRIVEAFRTLYPAAWLSTGASKGGMTSVFHRRFYPDDVDGTVAYVAPINFGAPDQRYQSFFDSVGTQSCRDALHQYQRETLIRRQAMEIRASSDAAGYTFDFMGGIAQAFESEISGLEWTFWQYAGSQACSYIPSTSASDDELYDFFAWIDGIDGSSDQNIQFFLPYYFQCEVELGYPDYHADYLDDLLVYSEPPLDGIYPEGFDRTYDPTAMTDIADWVASEGNRLLFVYGEYDPWTVGKFELGDATDSYLLTVAQGSHYASIRDLAADDRNLALDALEEWTGVTPDTGRLRAGGRPPRHLPPMLGRR